MAKNKSVFPRSGGTPKPETKPDTPKPVEQVSVFREIWLRARPFVVSFSVDLICFSIVLVGLYIAFLFEHALKLAGYEQEKVKLLGDLHYWICFVVVLMLGIDFIVRLLLAMVSEKA
jgi:hypothetical protein